jgi:Asp-tRNA(Asn)/Glu-tRNA(Gln) amidotransferase C subunit
MAENHEKVEVLNRIIAAASEAWGAEEVENMRSTLEQAAEAFWTIEAFPVTPMEEPAHSTSILRYARKRQRRGTRGP